MKKYEVLINKDKCIGCGICANTCAANNLVVKDHKAKIIFQDCMMCGQCSGVCPKAAITIGGYEDDTIMKHTGVRLNPQEVLDVIRFRRTIRQFSDKEIPSDVIAQILEAGRLTHTAKNMQDVSFVVLDKEKKTLEQMAIRIFKLVKPFANLCSEMTRHNKIHDHFFFFKAPIVIVIFAKEKENGILAAQNMEFVAEANGLGVLYSGFFTMAANLSFKIKKALGKPKGKKIAMTLVLGYPNVRYQRSVPRKAIDVHYM